MTLSNHSNEPIEQFEERKQDHIRLALNPENEAAGSSGLDRISLRHEALPELDFSEIDISTQAFGKVCPTPFFICSMTAGHSSAQSINLVLAQASAQQGWLMGVGSQRRQLFDASAKKEWLSIRKEVPDARLIGNIGLSQLIQTPMDDIERMLEPLAAEALFIHTNPVQECLQPEGTPYFKGGLQAIENICQKLCIPVIFKETGCGFSKQTLSKLLNCGLYAVDLSGLGGTHWGRIEGKRSITMHAQAAQTFRNWGISTVSSLLHGQSLSPDYELWASGGVRSGLDAAKLLAIGAKHVGFAKPILEAALAGYDTLSQYMQRVEFELKMSLFCTGSCHIEALRENDVWAMNPPQ